MIAYNSHFRDSCDQVTWHGKVVEDQAEFNTFLSGATSERLNDEVQHRQYEADLRALATTQMASDTIARLLTSEPEKEPWEVGEALAESLLEEERGVRFPWNTERDKRTPKASLPGVDLVGFVENGDDATLVLGEVKTSSELSNPPQVMYGMTQQLETLANNTAVQNCILKWLRVRCVNTDLWPVYQRAVCNYLSSGGRSFKLIGMLMRDTAPNELDLKNRAGYLSTKISAPTAVELDAWYLPTPVANWPTIVQGGTV